MTTFKAALRSALTETVGIPASTPQARTSHHKASSGSIQRQDGGYIVELLSEPLSVCPHCHRPLPRPQTRRRRLQQVVAGGRVLSVEID